MKTVTLTGLRRNIRKYFNSVEKGDTVRVLRHGRPIAQIRPDQDGAGPSWRRPLPRLVLRGEPLSKTLIDERRRARY